MVSETLREDFYSEHEMAQILNIKLRTLRLRIGTGTEHPPYIEIGRERLFPKDLFREWARKRPLVYEVKSVG